MSIGLSIHTCPVEIREKMAVPEDKWEEAVAELCSYPHVEEAGILSTCNRMEIYVVALSWHRGVREVEGRCAVQLTKNLRIRKVSWVRWQRAVHVERPG